MPHQIDIDIDIAEDGSSSKKAADKHSAIDALVSSLELKFRKYSSARDTKEQEWVNAIRQYQGMEGQPAEKKMRALGYEGTNDDLPAVNLTRQKTNIAIARLQDLQFPADGDYNFVISPTEDPDIEAVVDDEIPIDEEGTTLGALAQNALAIAKDKAYLMQAKLRDIMTEADYGKKARDSMEDLCVLGTAIMKGPTLQYKVRKKYEKLPTEDGSVVRVLSLSSTIIPDIQRVDPRLFYPDPNARPGLRMEDAFEVHLMTRGELIRLTRNEAYNKKQIRELLEKDPDTTEIANSIQNLSLVQSGQSVDNRYVVKEYHGPIDKDLLLALDLISEEQAKDQLVSMEGEVWLCQGNLLRMSLSHIEGDDDIPYAACVWEPDESNFFGHGVPYLMRRSAKVINASWMMLLDNASLTSGPQIVLNREMIEPANREEGWEIAPMKIWLMTEFGADVRQAMQFVDVPANTKDIAAITEMAMQFADIESNTPLMQQGEMPAGQNTTSGIAMVLSASNISQKRVSREWDDSINTKIVERLYHYVMQYDDDDSVKGDFEVKAGGATEHIDSQLRAQDLERILGMAQSNEEFMLQVDANTAFRQWVSTTRAGDILRSSEEVEVERQRRAEEAENAPPDPETVKAQADMLRAETAANQLEFDVKMREAELQIRQALENNKFQTNMLEIATRQEENQIDLQVSQMQRELELIKLAAAQEKSVADITKALKIANVTEETKRLQQAIDWQKFKEEIALAKQTGKGI
jgi:hypothetical protein